MVANFYVFGFKTVWISRKHIICEIFLQIGMVALIILHAIDKDAEQRKIFDAYTIFMLRGIRIVGYLREVKEIDLLIKSTRMITKPILTKFFFLYLVIYEFAQFGIFFFGS